MKYLKRYNEDVRTRNSKSEYNAYRKEKLDDIESDVSQMFDMDGLEITTKDFGNIYLDINFEVNNFIDPDEYKEDFDRLIDYMTSRGYEFNYFDTHRVYWMSRMIFTWKDLFDIPHHYKKQMNKLTIHFHNMKWEEEDAEFGINESNSINEGLSKRSYVYDINDILRDLDMVDIPSEYKQDIEFDIANQLDNDRILRIEISGSENKLIPLSVVDETLERLKAYLNTIGCKLAIKYYDNGWSDHKPRLTKKILLGIKLNLYKTLQARYNKSNYYMLLNDKNTIVVLDNEMPHGNRTYYISFKGVDSNSRYSTLKFDYKSNSRNFINFVIHDNHGNLIKWSNLSYLLNTAGIDYGIFNNGFSYMENDFNSKSYSPVKTKKFFEFD